MPAQPLSHYRKAKEVSFSVKALDERPGLAIRVMGVINTWAHIDHMLTIIASTVLKADFKIVAEMLRAISGGEAKRAAILAAVNTGLPDEAELFAAIWKATKPSRNRRNEFAHHLWGTCPQLPDDLLLADPRVSSVKYASYLEAKKSAGASPGLAMFTNFSEIMVYRDRDLGEETRAARIAMKLTGRFFALADDTSISDQMRQKLLSEPAIQQALQPKSNGNNP